MQAGFFFYCVPAKRGVGGLSSKGFLAETVETGNKNRNLFQHHALFCQFCKDSLGKIDARKRVTGQSIRSSA